MARTLIGVNDAKAVKRWSAALAVDTSAESYFNSRFIGKGANAKTPIQVLTDLESAPGEQVSYDLLAQLKQAPIEGDNRLEGKEEKQRFYTDTIYIDQARFGVSAGGRMTQKRTLHNLRERAKSQLSEIWSRLFDELFFVYLSGARGTNDTYTLPIGYTGRANNALVTPDANHRLYGGDATAFGNIDSNDKFDLGLIDRAYSKAVTQGGGATNIPMMQPCRIDGEERFVCVMHTWQEDDLRSNITTGQWIDIQKAAAAAEGKSNPIFKGTLGMYRGVVLHSHRNVVRFNDAGSGSNVSAARALFMGAQAGIVAFGSPGTNMRFDWREEMDDRGNELVITSSSIFGTKKTTYTTDAGAQDFGVFALDTAAAD